MSDAVVTSLAALDTDHVTDLFQAGQLPDCPFTHRDHVRVAWELLGRHDLGLALHSMTAGVQTLAKQRGLPNLYHATITTFYMLAIADAMSASVPHPDFATFADDHPSILAKNKRFLLGFYDAETLDSERARGAFVLPGRSSAPSRSRPVTSAS